MSAAPESLLQLTGIGKRFPGVIANDDIHFEVGKGEIHALLGENGAGKSTLVKIIYGVMHADSGHMKLAGAPYAPRGPHEARARGVGMVFQHFSLFDALSVGDNVALGVSRELADANLNQRIVDISTAYGLTLDPARRVDSLSVGERQRVEIVRCLLQEPRLLIMDEPTSVLTPQEVETLFKTLRRLAAEGQSILYISHKLEEIRSLCDRATVLRGGRVVGACDPRRESARSMAEMMIGSSLAPSTHSAGEAGAERLNVNGLSLPGNGPFGVSLENISFSVRAGEILGVAGVAGNGQVELLEALSGERRTDPACVRIDGVDLGHQGPTVRRRHGLCAVPEERLGHGAVPAMTLWENVLLSARTRKGLEASGFLDLAGARHFAQEVVERFKVKTAGIDHAASSLSGGNLQKFIVGREILQAPTVLVVLQPTWGVDAAAAAAIHRALGALAAEGAAVLVISQDLDELMTLSTRFSVIAEGRLSPPQQTGTQSITEIGLLMGGARWEAPAEGVRA